jgi:predicted dehydrogenase
MGTQIHAGDNYRRAVEIVQAGVLGAVRRVHVWMGGRPNPGVRVKEATPPEHVNYDLWLGPAPYRPFHPSHFHFQWRYWWDFGGGMLADFGCHYMDLPHWALELTAPVSIEASGKKDYDGDNDVPGVMRVDYEYPDRGKLPPVHLTWYHGGWMPEGAEAYGKSSAVLFEGEKGTLLADYGTRKLFLGDGKDGGPTTCNFDYSGALAEAVLLGNVAYRSGEKLRWDAKAAKVTNTAAAEPFIRREYRSGWTL